MEKIGNIKADIKYDFKAFKEVIHTLLTTDQQRLTFIASRLAKIHLPFQPDAMRDFQIVLMKSPLQESAAVQ